MTSKIFNIIYIIVVISFLLLPNFVQATEINMNLTNTANIDNTNSQTNTTSNTTTLPQTYSSSTGSTVTSTLNSLPEANLGLTNILSIILIVIGVLLILLAIAIILRLRNWFLLKIMQKMTILLFFSIIVYFFMYENFKKIHTIND